MKTNSVRFATFKASYLLILILLLGFACSEDSGIDLIEDSGTEETVEDKESTDTEDANDDSEADDGTSNGTDDNNNDGTDDGMDDGIDDEMDDGIDDGTDNSDMDENTANTVLAADFILHQNNKVINLILNQEEYDKFLRREGDFRMVSNRVYEHFKDDFDFIFILSNEDSTPQGLYSGISQKAQNHVDGLGRQKYDATGSYGSQGRLKSVIHMPAPSSIIRGPFLHEICHYWGNHDFIESTVGGHWGFASTGGQLGGFDELASLGNNTYQGNITGRSYFGGTANGGNSVPYGKIELYIMGLIEASEVGDIQIAENPVYQGSGKFTADNIKTVTMNDLIAQHGARVPSVQNSQKEFNAISVVLSSSMLDDSKLETISNDLENFTRKADPDSNWGNSLNFWQATFGKASINVGITQDSFK